MEIVALGVNHETAAVELREKVAFSADALPGALESMTKLPGVSEGMIVSTCNRVELYAAVQVPAAGLSTLAGWLGQHHGLSGAELDPRLYRHEGARALRHVFRVASSLDSLVIGEPQIVAQVKDAYQLALSKRAAGPILNRVLHKAFQVAKRVRSETGISAHAVSVSYAAVELARKIFGELDDKTVLLVGAGEMGELAARHLQKNGAREVLVCNRTWERAVAVAGEFQGTPVHFEKLASWIAQADIVVCAAAADGYLVTRPMVHDAVKARRHRPIFLIDIAVPRVIEPAAGTLDDVFLYGIDDLRGVVDANIAERRREAEKAEKIVDAEAAEFAVTLSKVELGPLIGLFNGKLEAIRKAELARAGNLTAEQREAVERVTRAILGKIAHEPIAALKDGALDPETMRRIFNLAPVEEVPSLESAAAEANDAAVGMSETVKK